jgi:calcineurin-like phosphoesterase family protein
MFSEHSKRSAPLPQTGLTIPEKKRMKTYFISDTHFGHHNIIEFCNRPFASVLEMNQTMIDNWNKTVGVDDTIIHGGDFALGATFDVQQHICNLLNGHKILIRGNHDGSKSRMERIGFHEVYDYYFSFEHDLLVFHNPDSVPPTILELRDKCKYFFYGHIHERYVEKEGMFNICAEALGYTPRTLEEVIEIEQKRKP